MGDQGESLRELVAECRRERRGVVVVGHDSKGMAPRSADAARLDTLDHAGILAYRPQELVVTARAGTPLAELAAALAERGQMLPFDPPRYDGAGTFGGAIASGLSGPARPWRGSARDAVLGVEIVNGLGERLRFGGSVMKNVAGYDVSRLMTGARGTLGVILSASVRVAPLPAAEETRRVACGPEEAGAKCRAWARLPLPITATCWVDGELSARFSGSAAGVASGVAATGLKADGDPALWAQLRDHRHPFFAGEAPLSRLPLPRGADWTDADALIEWGGCLAWLRRAVASDANAQDGTAKYARRIKQAFDPDGILNPGVTL